MSLFLSVLLILLGGKNKYCLSFGIVFLGIAIVLFSLYASEKQRNALIELNKTIDEVDIDEELDEEEKVYILQQLYIRQKKLTKQEKRMKIVSVLFGFAVIVLGIFGMF